MFRHIRFVVVFLTILLFLSCSSFFAPLSAGPPAATTIDVFFSPRGGATEALVRELGNAKKEIFVQAYSFTSAPIAKALVDAHKRGVKVTVVLDRSQRSERYTSATFVANAGIPTYIDAKHAIAHNKIMIIDGATLITGSFNFTKAAEEKNAENLLVIKGDPGLVKKYLENFEEHLGHQRGTRGDEFGIIDLHPHDSEAGSVSRNETRCMAGPIQSQPAPHNIDLYLTGCKNTVN